MSRFVSGQTPNTMSSRRQLPASNQGC